MLTTMGQLSTSPHTFLIMKSIHIMTPQDFSVLTARCRTGSGMSASYGRTTSTSHCPWMSPLCDQRAPHHVYPDAVATAIVHQRANFDRAAALITTVHIADPATHFSECAHSFPRQVDTDEVLRAAQISEICHERMSQGFGACALYSGFQRLPDGQAHQLHHGIGMHITVPPALSEDELAQNFERRVRQRQILHPPHNWNPPPEDAPETMHPRGNAFHDAPEDSTSFMARQPRLRESASNSPSERTSRSRSSTTSSLSSSSSTSEAEDWRQTVIFSLDGRSISTPLPWHDQAELYRLAALEFDIAPLDIIRLHLVLHRPLDYIQVNLHGLLIQRTPEFRPTPFDRLILLDLELHVNNNVQPTPFRRCVRWLPYAIDRTALFHFLGLEEILAEHEDICHLWKNNIIVPQRDRSRMNILDGDYIKIFVGDADIQEHCISESDAIIEEASSASNGSDDLSAFFQRSVNQIHQAFQGFEARLGKITSKTDPTQIEPDEQATHHPLARVPRPTRLTFQRGFHPDDHRKLVNIFERDAFVECEEEGKVAYIETWSIHHGLRRHCREPRALKLHADPQHWAEEILELWDLNGPQDYDIILHLVQPTPPCTRFQCVLAHIIVEQEPRADKTVGIISIEATDHRGMSLEHEAHSLSDYMGRNMVLRTVELEVFCQTRICTVSLGALPFGLVDIEEVPRAVCLTVHIRPVLLHAGDGDFVDLMQRSNTRWRRTTPPQEGQDLSSSPARCAGTAFVFNPNAPAFDPEIPFIGRLPESVQELHQAWQRTAFSWEGGSPSTSVITWFVDQHNPALHHCQVPRVVRLFDNFDHWETNFRQVWHDFALPGAPIMIQVVLPPPVNLDHETAAHVLLIQNPMDQFSTSLITGFDSTANFPGRPVFQLAMTTLETLYSDHLVIALGLGGRCLFPGSPMQCAVRLGNHAILPGVPFPARDGHGLTLQITPRPTFQNQQQQNEGPALLQLSTLLHRTRASGRQTTASVAQEQWPLPCDTPRTLLGETCKLDNHSVVEGPVLSVPFEAPEPPGRPEIHLGEHIECMDALHHQWWLHSAVEVEEEGRVLFVSTWYADGTRWPSCDDSRPVRLLNDPGLWADQLAEAWDDKVDPDCPLHLYLLTPQPRSNLWAPIGTPHVLIVQNPLPDHRSVHIATLDPRSTDMGIPSCVRTIPAALTRMDLLTAVDLQHVCLPGHVDCMIWWGEHEFRDGHVFPVRHGFAFLIIRNNLAIAASSSQPAPGLHALSDSGAEDEEQLALLQTKVGRRRVTLSLDSLVSDDDSQSQETIVPIRLLPGADMPPLPTYLECESPGHESQIKAALQQWGHQCEVHRFDQHEIALCLPQGWTVQSSLCHYMFSHSDVTDTDGAFLHTAEEVMNDHDMMRFLYALGYWRAVILSCDELRPGLRHVIFENVTVRIPAKEITTKSTPCWPSPLSTPSISGCLFELPDNVAQDDCVVRYGVSLQDVHAFFDSADGILQRDPVGYDFPLTTQAALRMSSSVNLADFDRIIIYTDGSSHAMDKHKPALWNAELGRPDTWAFTVLGECYQGSEGHSVEVLGWLTHEVHYEADSPHYLGAESLGSDIAEREALTWAGLWRLAHNVATPTLFRTDSKISALQATGQIGCHDQGSSFQCFRGVFQALETALPGNCLQMEHIPGHTQEPFNDMVDWLAKMERTKSFYCQRQKISMTTWRKILPHFWTFFSFADGLPPKCTAGLHAYAPSLPPATKTSQLDEKPLQTNHATLVQMTLSLCTANIASMYNGSWGHAGKTGYLRQQFQAMRLLFLGIQESRTPETFSAAENVLRIGSGQAQGGLYGVELWANLNVPYGRLGHRDLFLKRADFQVLHRDPRTLLVRVVTEFVHFALLVGYAPQSGLPLIERSTWWETFQQIASLKAHDDQLFVFPDANADPGQCDFRHVLKTGFKQTANTDFLRTFLSAHDLCLPMTSQYHHGSVDTWTSPSGLHSNSIDHVCIPCDSLDRCTFSSVLPDFDLGNGCFDHFAVALQLEWQECAYQPTSMKATKSRSSCRPFCRTTVTRAHVQQVMQAYTPAPWHQDVEQQVEDFNWHLLDGVGKRCPRSAQKPKKAFIPDSVWHLRLCKLERRKALKQLEKRRSFELIQLCFLAFAKTPAEEVYEAFWKYDTWLLCCKIRVFGALHRAAALMRVQLKEAKNAHLRHLFQALPSDAPASMILHELKQVVGSTNLRKMQQKALPFIRNEQGQVCHSPKEALDTWVQFFMLMEGGQRIDSDRQRREWIANLASFRVASLDLALADLPSLCELENAYKRVKPGKATGPDGVDALLCHLSPADFAKKTYSLLLKTITHGQESLIHKGGRLHPLWKGKGAKDICAAYRSILVSSHIGKTIHRCLRVHSADLFEKYLQKQQLGGKRRISVATGVHQARAFLRSRRQRGLNVGMVFLDLCEAFYRIVRELAIGGPACDEMIASMGNRLGMGPDLLHALYQHLDDDHALARAGFSQQMQLIVRSLHSDTHFSLQGQEDRCKKRLGTRPGDSWADLIFSFLWARLLRDLETEFQEAGLIDNVPAESGLRSALLPCTMDQSPCTTTVGFLGPTWMDDSVFCFADPRADNLERKAAHLCGLLIQKCKEFAMTPNLSPGKTAVMLVFQGPGSIAAKKSLFGPNAPKTLTILTEYDVQHVHIVTTYTHLGCLLHHKGDMRQEARRRFSTAQTAFQQHRRLLYQNKQLSLRRRAEIFRTLILSKFVYGCESWTLSDANTRHFVHTSLIRLYKRLIHHAHVEHLSDDEVLKATGLPDPSTLLRMQRLRHLGALYATADSSAWGVLNEDTEWVALICSDLDWMWAQLCGSSDLQDPRTHLATWTYLMLHHRGYWKKLILRAGAHAAAQRDKSA